MPEPLPSQSLRKSATLRASPHRTASGCLAKKKKLIIFNVTIELCTESQPVEALGHVLR